MKNCKRNCIYYEDSRKNHAGKLREVVCRSMYGISAGCFCPFHFFLYQLLLMLSVFFGAGLLLWLFLVDRRVYRRPFFPIFLLFVSAISLRSC